MRGNIWRFESRFDEESFPIGFAIRDSTYAPPPYPPNTWHQKLRGRRPPRTDRPTLFLLGRSKHRASWGGATPPSAPNRGVQCSHKRAPVPPSPTAICWCCGGGQTLRHAGPERSKKVQFSAGSLCSVLAAAALLCFESCRRPCSGDGSHRASHIYRFYRSQVVCSRCLLRLGFTIQHPSPVGSANDVAVTSRRTSLGVTGCRKEIAKDRDNVPRMSRDADITPHSPVGYNGGALAALSAIRECGADSDS